MKIIRNIIVIILAWSLISGWSAGTDQSAAAAESILHSCDHTGCEETITKLEQELAQAQACRNVILRVEIEIVPGILGDWAVLSFNSQAIRINRAACEGLEIGMDLSESITGEESWLSRIVDCRIIVADIAESE